MSNVYPIEQRKPDAPATRADLEAVLSEIKRLIKSPRRRLTGSVKALHDRTVIAFFRGFCPCCQSQRVIGDDGVRLASGQYDHWTDNPSKSSGRETWLVCEDCNSGFATGRLSRQEYTDAWNNYQRRRKACESGGQLEFAFTASALARR